MRVGERRDRLRFAREPRAHLLVGCHARRQHLDRDQAIEARVGGAEDLAHPACPEKAVNAVRTERRAGSQIKMPDEQRRDGRPHRLVEDNVRRVLPEERLDFAPQRIISGTRVGK